MPPIGRRILQRAALTAVVGGLIAGCGSAGGGVADGGTVPLFGGTVPPGGPAIDLTPSGVSAGGRVVMIGDSITVAAKPELEAQARQLGFDLTVDAEVGRRITVGSTPESGVDVLQAVLAEETPDLLVVALGANDIANYRTVEEYAAQIDRLLDLVPGDVPVLWIDAYVRRSPEASEQFNDALLGALRRRGNAMIGRWSDIAAGDGVLADGVHPSQTGIALFSDLVGDSIAAWIG